MIPSVFQALKAIVMNVMNLHSPRFFEGVTKRACEIHRKKGGTVFVWQSKKIPLQKVIKFLRNPLIKGSSLICLI